MKYEDIALSQPNMVVDTIHDGRHQLDAIEFARESIPYTLHIPELQIAAFTYTWVNAPGEAGAAIALFGPGVGSEPFQQRMADRPVSDEMNFSDWRIDSFHMSQDLQFRSAEVSWQTPDAGIEFTFEAIHPPYAYGSHVDGCPDFCAVDRIEQSGRVTGKIRLGGKVTTFETLGHRDHSWGCRQWRAFQFYHWFEGKSADGSIVVHFWRYLAYGVENIRGYVVKACKMAQIVSVETNITYDNLWQQGIELIVMDDLGRRTHVNADFYARHPLVPAPEIELREAAGKASYDGKTGLAWLEVGWPSTYLNNIT